MRVARLVLTFLAAGGSTWAQRQYTISTVAGGAPALTPGPAVSATLGTPAGITTDGAGNVYFSSLNAVYRIDHSGVLTRFAGNSHAGNSGDSGLATNAELNSPTGLACDSKGNLYIADTGNNEIRRVSADGTITNVAGSNFAGYYGDGGTATHAAVNQPTGVAVDGSGNLYIADSFNNVVREVSGGVITTVVGSGLKGYAGDGGPANAAYLYTPTSIALDSSGNLYISDKANSVIRKVSGGNIVTIAGTNVAGFAGDGGAATSAQLNGPNGLVVDGSGNVFFADEGNSRIRKIDSSGKISTVAGNGSYTFAGDGGSAISAALNLPAGVAIDSSGNLYIADTLNNRIRMVSSGGSITTAAGNGIFSFSGDGGPAVAAQLYQPSGVRLDLRGNILISDTNNNRLRKVSNGTIVTIAGDGTPGYSGDGGPASKAQVNQPLGIAVDAAGRILFADSVNHVIRAISPGGTITTFAGNGTPGYSGDGAAAGKAQLSFPGAVTVDASGSVYIADTGNHCVRKVSVNGAISTIAGTGEPGYSGDSQPASKAMLDRPTGVAVDGFGNVYIADSGNVRVRSINSKGTIATFAGDGSVALPGNGTQAASSPLSGAQDVAVDGAGNLYIAGALGVEMAAPDGTVTTLVGYKTPGYSGDGGISTDKMVNGVAAIALDPTGNVYLADSNNNAIRLLEPSGPGVSLATVVNAASNLNGPIASGEIVVLYGSGLGPSKLTQFALDDRGLVGTDLAGTSVVFNGTPGPVLYTSPKQIAAVVPYSVSGTSAHIDVEYEGLSSASIDVKLAPAAPAFFTEHSAGTGQAVAINQDGSLNSSTHPASAGSIVTLYATGGGQTSPAGVDGKPGRNPLPRPVLPVVVTIGGSIAKVNFAGGAPNLVAGVMQINVEIPSGLPAGAASIVLEIGGIPSPSDVTIVVSGN